MPSKTHGMARTSDGKKTPEYSAWSAMKQRCYNPKNTNYRTYGGRGITVSQAWRDSFEQFLKDMGPKPGPEYSIERRHNNQGYSKGNCEWATVTTQNLNQRDRLRVCRKTDASMLHLVPELHAAGFSHRSIASLFGVGKTTISKILAGDFADAVELNGALYVMEARAVNEDR